jgi:hypothetical protein
MSGSGLFGQQSDCRGERGRLNVQPGTSSRP